MYLFVSEDNGGSGLDEPFSIELLHLGVTEVGAITAFNIWAHERDDVIWAERLPGGADPNDREPLVEAEAGELKLGLRVLAGWGWEGEVLWFWLLEIPDEQTVGEVIAFGIPATAEEALAEYEETV